MHWTEKYFYTVVDNYRLKKTVINNAKIIHLHNFKWVTSILEDHYFYGRPR